MVSEVPDPQLPIMFSSVVDVALLGSFCASAVARVWGAGHFASESPGGVCSATVGCVAATLTSVVPA